MRQFGELLNDLGFNPEAPIETQKAFVRHLVRVAEAPFSRTLKMKTPTAPVVNETPLQLSFNAEILGIASQVTPRRRR